MFNKSKNKTVVKKTVTNRTNQIQTVTSSSTSRSNAYFESREVRTITSGTRSTNINGFESQTRSVKVYQSSTDAMEPNPFKAEFGSVNETNDPVHRGLVSTNKTDAKMLTPLSNYTSTYGSSRPEPGGYRSPYRSTFVPNKQSVTNSSKISTPVTSTTYRSIYTTPSSSTTSNLAKGSSATKPAIEASKSTAFSQLKSIFNSPVAKTAEVAALNVAKKELAQKKVPKVGPGVVYIFNHEKFDNDKEFRSGTYKDVQKLKEVFGRQFKMEIKLFNDLKVQAIEVEVAKIEKTDFNKKACIVIVILTHGTRHDVVCAKDNVYSIDDTILFPMLKNKSLYDKPKIFIIQACKGDNATEQYIYTDAKKTTTLNAPIEIAKLYSTFEGFLSYRGNDGSLFIQIFCENLQKDGKTKNVIEIMEGTIKKIVADYKAQQVPTITHNMTKPLIFGSYL